MTFLLQVDGPRWQANVDQVLAQCDDPTTGGRVVPVAKSNGYGLGQAVLSRQMRARNRAVLSVGTVFEAIEQALEWDGDLLVLTPWNVADQVAQQAWQQAWHDYGTRLITGVGDTASLRALAQAARPDRPTRVLIEGLTSVQRFGFIEPEVHAVLRDPVVLEAIGSGALRFAGTALHLPIATPDVRSTEATRHLGSTTTGPVAAGSAKVVQAAQWAQVWLARMAELQSHAGSGADFSAAADIWVSHLTATELQQLRAALPGTRVHPRIGTALWLGDVDSLQPSGVVLAVHAAAAGGAGYFQRRVPSGAHLVVVGGGTNHGVGLTAPIGAASLRRRVTTAGNGLLDAAGRPVSAFRWQGKRLWLHEAPHASVSLVIVGKGIRPPTVGDLLPAQVRLSTARFDEVLGLH